MWNIAGISWDMLSFDILGGATYPVLTMNRVIAIFLLIKFFLLDWWVHVEISLLKLWFADSDINIVS